MEKDHSTTENSPFRGQGGTAFAPVLAIANGTADIDFYKKAFNATENFCLRNDDGSIHVAELVIDGAVFHLHEITEFSRTIPAIAGGGTVNIGLFVADVYAVFNQAIAAGAVQTMPVTDFEYGYRQGELIDPFGHKWIIQCRIPAAPDWINRNKSQEPREKTIAEGNHQIS